MAITVLANMALMILPRVASVGIASGIISAVKYGKRITYFIKLKIETEHAWLTWRH